MTDVMLKLHAFSDLARRYAKIFRHAWSQRKETDDRTSCGHRTATRRASRRWCVTPAQPLMVIVPTDNVLEVEAMLPNKDIGFVNPGQDAEVKVETFPFTKYGTLHGTIT
jgi:multidrug resistance efflux pump